MLACVKIDETGVVLGVMPPYAPPPDGWLIAVNRAPEGDNEAFEVNAGSLEYDDLWNAYLNDGILEPRTQIAGPTMSGGVVTFPVYPDGTEMTVRDLSGGNIVMATFSNTDPDYDSTVRFLDAGLYEIDVTPTAPYLGLIFRAEVTWT